MITAYGWSSPSEIDEIVVAHPIEELSGHTADEMVGVGSYRAVPKVNETHGRPGVNK